MVGFLKTNFNISFFKLIIYTYPTYGIYMELKTEAFQVVDRIAKPAGSSTHVYVPKAWNGRRVKILLLEDITEDMIK